MAQVLLIQLARVGDVIQTTPLIQSLLTRGMEVDVLVQLGNETLFNGLAVRTVYPVDPAIVKELNETLAAGNDPAAGVSHPFKQEGLGLPRYDWVINLSNHRCGAWLCQQIAADHRSGGVMNGGEWKFEGDWPIYLFALMEARNQNRFNLVDVWRGLTPGAVPVEGTRAWMEREEIPADWLPSGRIVALNPGANDPARRWPAASFARVAEGLKKIGVTAVLVGSPADQEVCAAVRAASHLAIPDFSGRTSFGQMASLLSKVELLLSNDTAAAHMAAAVGTPVVALYGGEAFFRETAPWGAGHFLLQAGRPGAPEPMENLPVRIVLAVVMNRLSRATRIHIQNELAAARAAAWETAWIPAGLDPLGGITYRPLHAVKADPSEVFLDALRHVIAWDLCGRPQPGPGEAVVAALASQTGILAPEAMRDVVGFSNSVVQFVGRMEEISNAVGEIRHCRDAGRRQALLDHVTASIGVLYDEGTQQESGVDLIVRYVNWKLKMQPHPSAEATLDAYQAEYQRAAGILSQTLAIWSLVLEAVAPSPEPVA